MREAHLCPADPPTLVRGIVKTRFLDEPGSWRTSQSCAGQSSDAAWSSRYVSKRNMRQSAGDAGSSPTCSVM